MLEDYHPAMWAVQFFIILDAPKDIEGNEVQISSTTSMLGRQLEDFYIFFEVVWSWRSLLKLRVTDSKLGPYAYDVGIYLLFFQGFWGLTSWDSLRDFCWGFDQETLTRFQVGSSFTGEQAMGGAFTAVASWIEAGWAGRWAVCGCWAATEFLVCKDKEPQQPACLHLVKQFASEGRWFQIRLTRVLYILAKQRCLVTCPFSDGKGRQVDKGMAAGTWQAAFVGILLAWRHPIGWIISAPSRCPPCPDNHFEQ